MLQVTKTMSSISSPLWQEIPEQQEIKMTRHSRTFRYITETRGERWQNPGWTAKQHMEEKNIHQKSTKCFSWICRNTNLSLLCCRDKTSSEAGSGPLEVPIRASGGPLQEPPDALNQPEHLNETPDDEVWCSRRSSRVAEMSIIMNESSGLLCSFPWRPCCDDVTDG